MSALFHTCWPRPLSCLSETYDSASAGRPACAIPYLLAAPIACASAKPSISRPPVARPATPNLLALPPFLKKGIDTLKDQWVDARTGG